MSRSEDDDAFRWDGDDDPTLSVTPEELVSESTVVAEGSLDEPAPAPEPEPEPEQPNGIGNVALVAYGVFGGVYALWTVGWILGALRLRDRIETVSEAVADFMFQGSMVLGILAPAIWFLTVLAGTRGKSAWQRFLWLGLGILVLIPWPFVMVGVVGK